MSDNTVTIETDSGDRAELLIGESSQVSCPDCGSENVGIHGLNRVLAGECAACFNTWTIGTKTDWEVVNE